MIKYTESDPAQCIETIDWFAVSFLVTVIVINIIGIVYLVVR